MDKDDLLRARVPSATKANFEKIAESAGRNPSELLRDLVHEYVAANIHRLPDRVVVHIGKPRDYQPGAWTVLIKLRDPNEGIWLDHPISFALPELKLRRLASDKDYGTVVGLPDFSGYTSGGIFLNGVWRGHLYSNGIPEDENPTTIEEVRQRLRDDVTSLLDRFDR